MLAEGRTTSRSNETVRLLLEAPSAIIGATLDQRQP